MWGPLVRAVEARRGYVDSLRYVPHLRWDWEAVLAEEEFDLDEVDPEAVDPDAPQDDVDLTPSEVADSAEMVAKHVPADILRRYEVYSYRSAALILKEAHPAEFAELMGMLGAFP